MRTLNDLRGENANNLTQGGDTRFEVAALVELILESPPERTADVAEGGRFICVDGPSGSGKNSLFSHLEARNLGLPLSVLDTNVFMKRRKERKDRESRPLFSNWYRVDYFKEKVAEFLNPKNQVCIDQAYKHDRKGDTSHAVAIRPGSPRVLMGRYSLHPEIRSVLAAGLVDPVKIIIDAPQALRLDRVRQRARVRQHRTPEQQAKLIVETVDPDWTRYFPSIFRTADWYMVNYADSFSTYHRPEECINRSHAWGAFADLHVEPDKTFRLIEIGKGGATSLHVHRTLDEEYFHVLGGALGVTVIEGRVEQNHVLTVGQSLLVPHGVYHRVYALDAMSVVYYETVVAATGSCVEGNDIRRLSESRARSGPLSYL